MFSRKFLLHLFSRENSCCTYFLEKIHACLKCIFSAGAWSWLSGCFYAFNLRKSEILGTVDRNVQRNSLENSRDLVRNREEKLTGIFSIKYFLEKIRVKSGEKLFSRKILWKMEKNIWWIRSVGNISRSLRLSWWCQTKVTSGFSRTMTNQQSKSCSRDATALQLASATDTLLNAGRLKLEGSTSFPYSVASLAMSNFFQAANV